MTTRMPGVPFVESPNRRHGGVVRPPRGMVLHIAAGTYEGTLAWQANPSSQISSYFVVAHDGRVTQCVDLDDRAWTESAGNAEWIGVEFEGQSGDTLTAQQLAVAARIYAWLVGRYGIPIASTDDPHNGRGLAWHGMGGDAWGGHPNCPGAPIVAQRSDILGRVRQLLGGPSTPAPRPLPTTTTSTITGKVPRMLTNISIATDAHGNGWGVVHEPWSSFIAATAQGSDPSPGGDGGYWPSAVVAAKPTKANHGASITVTVRDAPPNQAQSVLVATNG